MWLSQKGIILLTASTGVVFICVLYQQDYSAYAPKLTSLSTHHAGSEEIKFRMLCIRMRVTIRQQNVTTCFRALCRMKQTKLKTINSRDILTQLNGFYFMYLLHSLCFIIYILLASLPFFLCVYCIILFLHTLL